MTQKYSGFWAKSDSKQIMVRIISVSLPGFCANLVQDPIKILVKILCESWAIALNRP